ncbi:Na-translocating system protein MpsC family protein [Metabacillus malikii]|uniref:Uncharacterized protein YbcI n=1 Tax=Metabacillus malikii TaxID=1504265 RepID=A0ABT9ZEC5_9BACI|nr:Na-translocating system protein MpsC family protein [Metabacillus malikii]MDQ0230370.1 uncharacterized protein YbcI [Metabacillus malikii]
MQIQDQLSTLSGYASKLLRKVFGRGPKSCQAFANQQFLVIYIRGFLSPMEEALISQGRNDYVERARNVIMKPVLEELRGVIQITLDVEVNETYHDWNISNYSGLIMFVLNSSLHNSNHLIAFNSAELENQVSQISAQLQKVPDQIHTYSLSEQIVLVERKGILITLEKALINHGFGEELRMTKDNLEKDYFLHERSIIELFQRPIADLFIDWDFVMDKSLMCFIIDNR